MAAQKLRGGSGAGVEDGPRLVCPCGVDYRPLVRGRDRLAQLGWGVLAPLLTLVIYAFAVLVAYVLTELPMAGRIAVAALPVYVFIACLFVQSAIGHRGGCLWRRALRFTFVWPGRVLAELGAIP